MKGRERKARQRQRQRQRQAVFLFLFVCLCVRFVFFDHLVKSKPHIPETKIPLYCTSGLWYSVYYGRTFLKEFLNISLWTGYYGLKSYQIPSNNTNNIHEIKRRLDYFFSYLSSWTSFFPNSEENILSYPFPTHRRQSFPLRNKSLC